VGRKVDCFLSLMRKDFKIAQITRIGSELLLDFVQQAPVLRTSFKYFTQKEHRKSRVQKKQDEKRQEMSKSFFKSQFAVTALRFLILERA